LLHKLFRTAQSRHDHKALSEITAGAHKKNKTQKTGKIGKRHKKS